LIEQAALADIKREVSGERPVTGDRLGGLGKIAKQLAEERPDDLLVQLVFKMASREDIERMQ
jgi:hypothetical protein